MARGRDATMLHRNNRVYGLTRIGRLRNLDRLKLRGYAATGLQAQRLREKAEDLFLQHRQRGGYGAQNDQTLPKEERSALYELKQEGNKLWEEAKELVQAASEQVLRESQVSMAKHGNTSLLDQQMRAPCCSAS